MGPLRDIEIYFCNQIPIALNDYTIEYYRVESLLQKFAWCVLRPPGGPRPWWTPRGLPTNEIRFPLVDPLNRGRGF